MLKTTQSPTHTQPAPAGRTPFFSKGKEDAVDTVSGAPYFVQQKLVIGQRDDAFEREADAVADKVLAQDKTPAAAPAPAAEAAPPAISRVTLPSAAATPAPADVQAKEEQKEDEPEQPPVQRRTMAAPPADTLPATIQMKEEPEQREPEQLLQKKEEPEQREPAATPVKRFEVGVGSELPGVTEKQLEDKTPVQRKPVFESDASQDIPLQRKADSAATPAAPLQGRLSASKGGGQPLAAQTRTDMQSAMGADFSQVRIHTDHSAIQMSRDIHAQAFTHGKDIYFNEGKYDPASNAGKHLLAHELTHTVQQGAAVRRDNTPSSQPSGRDPSMLNNQQLLDELRDAGAAQANQEDAGTTAYLQQLTAEKGIRAQAGQMWLNDAGAGTMSQALYQVLPSDQLAAVVLCNTDQVMQGGRDMKLGNSQVVTAPQLENALARFNNPAIAAAVTATSAIAGNNIRLVPPEMITMYHGTNNPDAVRQGISPNPKGNSGSHQDLGPGFYTTRSEQQGQQYADWRTQQQGGTAENMKFVVAMEDLGKVVDVTERGAYSAQFQDFVNTPLEQLHPAYGRSFPGITVGQFIHDYSAVSAESRGEFFEIFLQRVNAVDADVIIAPLGGNSMYSGVALPGGSDQLSIRSTNAAAVLTQAMNGTYKPPAPKAVNPPMGKTLATGAAVGGVIAVLINGTLMLIDTKEHPDWYIELTKSGAIGAGGGAMGSALDTRVATAIINRGATPLMGRMGGGAVAGGVVAPIVVMTSMALDDQKHSGAEYAGKGTRAAVAGGLSGAVAAGVTGAIFGSEVPVLGNVVGFAVGFLAYMAIDAIAGDTIEQGVENAVK